MILGILTILIVGFLLLLYYLKIINTFQIVVISWITSTYYLPLGTTINVYFFVSQWIILTELIYWLTVNGRIRWNTLLLMLTPLLGSAFFFLTYLISPERFEILNPFQMVTNPIYFYLKTWLPLFFIGSKIYRESKTVEYWDSCLMFLKKILFFSCSVAVFQLLVFHLVDGSGIVDFIGIHGQYRYQLGPLKLVRINGLFIEPKEFAILTGLGAIILFEERKYKSSILTSVIGLLTLSNTFAAIVLIYFFFRVTSALFKSFRSKVLVTLTLTICFFVVVSQARIFFLNNYDQFRKLDLVRIVFERAVNRYQEGNDMVEEFMGLPMQADMEGPFIRYFNEYPLFFSTGFGPGNSTFIPNEYFRGTWAFKARGEGNRRWHVNMGWFFWIFEIGLIGTVLVFTLVASQVNVVNSTQSSFLALLICILFICRIELLVAAFLMAQRGKPEA